MAISAFSLLSKYLHVTLRLRSCVTSTCYFLRSSFSAQFVVISFYFKCLPQKEKVTFHATYTTKYGHELYYSCTMAYRPILLFRTNATFPRLNRFLYKEPEFARAVPGPFKLPDEHSGDYQGHAEDWKVVSSNPTAGFAVSSCSCLFIGRSKA